jgi:ABC-type Fe3+/spermidine/putrescine transport system ATPase subunit
LQDVAVELVDVSCSFGRIQAVDTVSLSIGRGEFFTLLGPSGSGKTTVMRLVAGLEHPDDGVVKIDGKDVSPVPSWRRNVGMVFQDYALFPHLDVFGNVAYGMKMKRLAKTHIEGEVRRLLEIVKLPDFGSRAVTKLSGGQKQRVALARALASNPSVLLLDEPLAALDEKVRREMQLELRRIQQETKTTFVYVTHDQEEALTMSDRVAVFRDGSCIQCDVPTELFERPKTRFVASFFRGFNVFELPAHHLVGTPARVRPEHSAPVDQTPSDEPLEVAIRAERVVLGGSRDSCDIQLTGILTQATYRGAVTDHAIVLEDGQRVVATSSHQEAGAGERVTIGMRSSDLVILERE